MNRYPKRGDYIKIGKQYLLVLSNAPLLHEVICIKRNDIGKSSPKRITKYVGGMTLATDWASVSGVDVIPLADVILLDHHKIVETITYTIK